MKYILNENVYLVRGKARACIYNFNTSKLYNINEPLADKIEQANLEGIHVDGVTPDLKPVLDEFVNIGILSIGEVARTHHIDELKTPDYGCLFAWIEITTRCNLKCKHCYNESDAHCNVTMSLNNFKKIVDKLVEMKVKKIQLIGGEPFCESSLLKEMLDYVVGKFTYIEIFTNGTLFTAEWYEYLYRNGIHIALSLYSYNELEHDKVTTVKGSWKKTNSTIENLQKYSIPYRVCNVLMRDISLGEKNTELYELSTDKDIVRMSGRANFSLLSEELLRKKLITKNSFRNKIQKSFSSRVISGHNCFNNKIYISADMKVYPCVMERRLVHGNVDRNGNFEFKEAIRKLSKDYINECMECEYRYACHDCRPNSLSGNIYEKPWYCTYDPQKGIWMDEDRFVAQTIEQWR